LNAVITRGSRAPALALLLVHIDTNARRAVFVDQAEAVRTARLAVVTSAIGVGLQCIQRIVFAGGGLAHVVQAHSVDAVVIFGATVICLAAIAIGRAAAVPIALPPIVNPVVASWGLANLVGADSLFAIGALEATVSDLTSRTK